MNAKDGTYLKKVFLEARYDTVKMYFNVESGRKDIYFPKLGSKRAKVIVYRNEKEFKHYPTRSGEWDPTVHIPGVGNVAIPTNTAWTFYNQNGKWNIGTNETWTDSNFLYADSNIADNIAQLF